MPIKLLCEFLYEIYFDIEDEKRNHLKREKTEISLNEI